MLLVRSLLFCLCSFVSALGALASDRLPPWPNPATFQSGDLLWPNKPGAFVPYSAGGEGLPDAAEQAWLSDRSAFIRKTSQEGTHLSKARIDSLKRMSFDEFYSRYAGDRSTGDIVLYSNATPFTFVGHVAIVDMNTDGQIWIIEASLNGGVTRKLYSDWLKPLDDYLIWHGRIRDLAPSLRREVADEARKYIGRPYDFWNFDLDDDKGFYCSKLVWLSVFRALHIPVDGNPTPGRQFWFSPKQLLNANKIVKLHNPSNYTRP